MYAYIELCLRLLDETALHKNAHECYPLALTSKLKPTREIRDSDIMRKRSSLRVWTMS